MLVMLGTLTMLPPLSIDISLPGLPLIARALDSTPAMMQSTLSVFVLALGLGQLVLGPLSDRYGRLPVLHGGLTVFVLAGLGCALATDARLLIAMRLFQGFGACAGTVCGRAIVRDLSTDRAGATFRLTVLSSVNALAPIIAPILGVLLLATLGWRWLYGILPFVGVALLVMVAIALPETSPRVSREVVGAYRRVLALPRTPGLLLTAGFAFAGFFPMITGSAFALMGQFHITSAQYAVAFAINALAFLIVALLSRRLSRTVDPERLLATGVGLVTAAGVLAWIFDTFAPSVGGFIGTWMLYAFGIAFTLPGALGALLAGARHDAGLAAGLVGAAQFVFGASAATIGGTIAGPVAAALGLVAITGATGCVLGYLLSRRSLGDLH